MNGVLVAESTYRATRAAIDYAEREPVEAKGKAEPVRVWEAIRRGRARGRRRRSAARTPLVGRDARARRCSSAPSTGRRQEPSRSS